MLPVDPAKYPGNSAAELFAKALATKPQPLYAVSGRSMLGELLDQIDAKWGSVDNFLKEVLGVGPAQVASLRAYYTE